MDLFADDDGGNLQVGAPSHQSASDFQINESYANRFEHNKQRAELHRLEEKYGKAAADILSGQRNRPTSSASSSASSSSDDETEDEEGEQVTAEVDAAILRTLAKIRSGDASIYDSSKKVFDEEKALAATSASLPRLSRDKTLGKGKKKMTLADYQRERLRDLMQTEEDPAKALAEATTSTTRREEEERQRRQEEEEYRNHNRPEPLSHVQEQELLKRQVTQAFHQIGEGDEAGDEEGDEGEGFFTKRRSGGEDDGTQDDDDPLAYRKYLLANLGQDGAEAAVRDALRYQIDEAQQQQQQPQKTGDDAAPARRTARKSKSNGAQDNEEFLMNYILNRGWMENPQAAPKLKRPRQSHDEDEDSDQEDESKPRNLSSTNGTTTRDWEAEAADLEDAASDASFDSRAEAFEQAFNFRYEALEAGKVSDQIQSYARQHPSYSSTNATVRRVEDKRKQEREERRRRKEAEKRSRMEEIDRLRELKKGSLREKLRQLKEAAGSTKLNIDEDELEGDFDEEKHEKLMKAFGEAYYGEEGDDDVKPTWDDDVDIEDILAEERQEENNGEEEKPKKLSKNQRKKELRRLQELAEEEEQEQEADDAVDDEGTSTSKLSKKDRKKLKKQAKKAGAASDATSNADPSSSTSSMTPSERREAARKLADEYRSLDYEDVIGDLPTRFHYTPVTKTNYGLTPVEILLADDKDLNEVVGLKYFQPYRRGHGDQRVRKPKDLNMKLREFRRKMEEKELGKSEARRLEKERRKRKSEEMGGGADAEGVKKRKGRKERQREKAAAEAETKPEAALAASDGTETAVKSEQPAPSTTAPDGAEAEKAKASKEKKDRNRAAKKAKVEEV